MSEPCQPEFLSLDDRADSRADRGAGSGIAERLIGHEGFVWQQRAGGWTCRCDAPLTPPGTPARPEDAREPWRRHIAELLSTPTAVSTRSPRSPLEVPCRDCGADVRRACRPVGGESPRSIGYHDARYDDAGWPPEQDDADCPDETAASAGAPAPPRHLGNHANGEDCPACTAEQRNLDYPFLCPELPGAPSRDSAVDERPA